MEEVQEAGGSSEAQSQVFPAGLEPLRSLAVATELIPMRSRMALHAFLQQHQEEFPARYMRSFAGKQQRMLYDSEIRRIREMLMVEPGMDEYHTEKFIASRRGLGTLFGGRARRTQSPIDEIMRRAMAR